MSTQKKRLPLRVLGVIEDVGLTIITIATIVAMGAEVVQMIENRMVTLADLLLLFIYLEVFAMIGIYFKSHRLPVRLPIYIAIVAMARYLILDMKALEDWRILAIAGAILVLMLTVLIHRYGHIRFPYDESGDGK